MDHKKHTWENESKKRKQNKQNIRGSATCLLLGSRTNSLWINGTYQQEYDVLRTHYCLIELFARIPPSRRTRPNTPYPDLVWTDAVWKTTPATQVFNPPLRGHPDGQQPVRMETVARLKLASHPNNTDIRRGLPSLLNWKAKPPAPGLH